MSLPVKELNEAPITFNVPPPPPAQVQTVQQQKPDSSGPITFKSFYKANVPDVSQAVKSSGNLLQKAAKYIEHSEGKRNKLYKDHKGNWTIGIGHLVKPQELQKFKGRVLSDNEVQEIFNNDIKSKLNMIQSEFGDQFESFSDNLKIAILDGYFRGDLSGSPRTIKLLKAGQFKDAAIEYLNNAEYRQSKAQGTGVASRMERNAEVMATEA